MRRLPSWSLRYELQLVVLLVREIEVESRGAK
jgi:hypothetical protein